MGRGEVKHLSSRALVWEKETIEIAFSKSLGP